MSCDSDLLFSLRSLFFLVLFSLALLLSKILLCVCPLANSRSTFPSPALLSSPLLSNSKEEEKLKQRLNDPVKSVPVTPAPLSVIYANNVLDPATLPEHPRRLTVSVVGAPNVGKVRLSLRIVHLSSCV
jgi:hypothetical protein